ncbi:hypothetical protein EDB86DRAFT_2828952 [Lactarius hatsudake]|nr:hypothetical protein EDB86DRAFT_2828952 [Lactarius hatsudake]
MECEGREVGSGGRKIMHTSAQRENLDTSPRGSGTRLVRLTKTAASAARRGMRWCSKLRIGVRVLEPIPVRRNDRRKPNGCNDAVDWVDIANSKLLLAANTELNSTDSAALERPSLPELEAWMRNANVWIAVGFNMTVQLYWDGGLIEHNLAPFRFVIPRDQVMLVA